VVPEVLVVLQVVSAAVVEAAVVRLVLLPLRIV
jgi:hypothetical protein